MASSCAGMGMDIKTVRLVVNLYDPRCGLEDWVLQQQSGRGGRDGEQAVCVNIGPKVRVANPRMGPAGRAGSK